MLPKSPTFGLTSVYFCSLGWLEKINPGDVLEFSDVWADSILVKSPILDFASVYLVGMGNKDVWAALKSPKVGLISFIPELGLTSSYFEVFENNDTLVLVNSPVVGLASGYLEILGKSDICPALDKSPILDFISAYLVALGNNGAWFNAGKSPIDCLVSGYLLLLGKSDVGEVLLKSEGVFELLKRPILGLASAYFGGFWL